MSYFQGKKAVIATKHKKEIAIKPIIEKELGLECIIPENFDTDIFGTFTGEVNRIDDPLTTLKKKCLLAIEKTGIQIAIANEGSFNPHPNMFFAQADDELIMLYDNENNIEIVEREINMNTNFSTEEIGSEKQLIEFANKIGFPSHGIILKKSQNDFSIIKKENKSLKELLNNFNEIKNSSNIVWAETDMRAMNNPTRMLNIEKATYKLINKVKSLCPECKTPGYGIFESINGLPCELCNFPTKSTLKHIYKCQKCNFKSELMYPNNKKFEDPQFCDICNP